MQMNDMKGKLMTYRGNTVEVTMLNDNVYIGYLGYQYRGGYFVLMDVKSESIKIKDFDKTVCFFARDVKKVRVVKDE